MLWINGQPSNGDNLLLDEGFLFGRGVFETIRVHQEPLFWEEHLARLNTGLQKLQIRSPLDPDELRSQIRMFSIRQCILKIVVSPANIVFQTRDLPPDLPDNCRLTLTKELSQTNPLLVSVKSLNYLANLLIYENARKDGFDDAILENSAGQITETSRANLFFVRQGQLYTPELGCGLLNGIIRQWIVDNISVQMGKFEASDLFAAEAVFITNSVSGIRPVRAIMEKQYPVSPLITRIKKEYLDFISR